MSSAVEHAVASFLATEEVRRKLAQHRRQGYGRVIHVDDSALQRLIDTLEKHAPGVLDAAEARWKELKS